MSHFMWRKLENFIHLLESYLLPGGKKEDWKWLIWKIGSLENSVGLVFKTYLFVQWVSLLASPQPEALTPRCRSSHLQRKDRTGNVVLKLSNGQQFQKFWCHGLLNMEVYSPDFLCGGFCILFFITSLYVTLFGGYIWKKNQFWTLGCFSRLAVLNKAILNTLIHIVVFLYAVELLGYMVDT